ncbi:hypothetical protein HY572_02980 [Candidatus Micrarchaeota archaeon]|nr:hypothetical protein [Candidatus Micrarchaeota archaeon]
MGQVNFKVAVIQMHCVAEVAKNVEKGLKRVQQAAENGAHVACLPELFSTGYYLRDLKSKVSDEPLNALQETAKALDVVIVAGLPEKTPEGIYNSAYVVDENGRVPGKYRKNQLFPGKPVDENDVFLKGDGADVIRTKYGRFGLQICFDLRYPNQARDLAEKGAEILFYPTAWGKPRAEHWRALLRARAIENQCFAVGCDRVGTDDMAMAGFSAVIDPWGTALVELDGKSEGIGYADIELKKVRETRDALPLW